MNYVDHLNLFGVEAKEIPCLKVKEPPTKATRGAVGLFAMVEDTGAVYKCVAADDVNGVYVWKIAEAANVEYYSTVRKAFAGVVNMKAEDIFALYRDLGAIENTLYDFKGNPTELKEYVFSTGDYNSPPSAVRGNPDDVHKPTFLVTSGIHGDELTTVLATYRFFADLVSDKNLPSYLAEGAIFKVVPLVNPNGFDSRTRGNANGVNLNRNFDYQWEEHPIFEHYNGEWNNYSGESVASEAETQAITNWLNDNKDAVAYFDMHCSSYDNEYVGLMGSGKSLAVTKAKKVALRGIDKVIPYWKSLLEKTDGITFYYSVDIDGFANTPARGIMGYYAAEALGIPGIVVECVSDSAVEVINGIRQITEDRPNADTIAIGAEVLGNMVLESYRQYAMDVNVVKKHNTIAEALAGGDGTAEGTVLAYDTGSMLNIVLTEDITDSETIEITKDCTIHLNGHELSFATGKHLYLTSGKLTVNGTVEGSKITKTIDNGSAENLVSVDGIDGTELHLFGGEYCITGTATGATVPIRAGSGKVAKMTLSGCTVTANCSGLAVYGIQNTDNATIDNCTFNIQGETNSKYPVSAIVSTRGSEKIAVRNSVIAVQCDVEAGVVALSLTSKSGIVENCEIYATATGEGAVCGSITANYEGMNLTVNNCDVEARGNNSTGVCALSSATGTAVSINNGHYYGDSKAFDLLGTVYINGEEVDGTTYTDTEYTL